jgi:sugar phosphate isomerase/epimerase
MKLGISIYSISRKIMTGEISPEKAVEYLADTGAEVIELVPFGIAIVGNKNRAFDLQHAASENGTLIANYSLNANFLMLNGTEYEAEFERVKGHIDAAAKLEIKTMRIDASSYRRKPEDNTIENFIADIPVIAETYHKLCDYAKQYNFVILLENHGFHINGSDRVGIAINAVKTANGGKIENFSHQLDIGNFLCVDENPEIAVKRLINKAATIHIKDFYIRDEECDPGDATQFDCSGAWFRSQGNMYLRGAILGQGDMKISRIIKIIKNSEFDGNVYLEYEGMEDCFYGTKVGFENMKRLFGK